MQSSYTGRSVVRVVELALCQTL